MLDILNNFVQMLRNFMGLVVAVFGVFAIELINLQEIDLKLKIVFQIIIFLLTAIYLIIKIKQKLRIKRIKNEKNI